MQAIHKRRGRSFFLCLMESELAWPGQNHTNRAADCLQWDCLQWVGIDGVQCVLSPAASRGVRSPAAPSMPMLASARALRSARDTGRVSMPCPSTEGARRPMDKSAFIATIFSPRKEAGVCGDARLPRAEEMW